MEINGVINNGFPDWNDIMEYSRMLNKILLKEYPYGCCMSDEQIELERKFVTVICDATQEEIDRKMETYKDSEFREFIRKYVNNIRSIGVEQWMDRIEMEELQKAIHYF